MSQIIYKNASNLHENRPSVSIYGFDEFDDEEGKKFLQSIAEKGVLEPIVIRMDGTIISGHRRRAAVLKMFKEGVLKDDIVPCRVVESIDILEEKELIVHYNRQRKKTFSQIMREAEVLEEVEQERAKQRQVSTLNFGPQVPLWSFGHNGESHVRTRDKVADEVGIGSGRTYQRARKVWDAAKSGDEKARELVNKLDAGEVSIHQAYQQVLREEKIRQKRAELQRLEERPPVVAGGPLIHGDCIAEMKKMTRGSISLILTDPPYFIEDEVRSHRAVNPQKFDPATETVNRELREFDSFRNEEEYYEFMRSWITEASLLLKPGGHMVVWVDRAKVTRVKEIGESSGLRFRQFLFWLKSNPVPMAGKTGFADAVEEMLWFIKPGGEPFFNIALGVHSNCFEAPIVQPRLHPTEKPVGVLKSIIEYLTMEGDVVLDLFAGSGSTLAAAMELNRKPLGIEKDDLYYKVAAERLAALDNRASS